MQACFVICWPRGAGPALLGACKTRGNLEKAAGACEWAALLLANAACENSGDLNVKQLHLNPTQTQTLWHIYCSLQYVSLVFCCVFAFLTGNIAFDPKYLVYKVLLHSAHWGSNEWQEQPGEATWKKVKPSRVLITGVLSPVSSTKMSLK